MRDFHSINMLNHLWLYLVACTLVCHATTTTPNGTVAGDSTTADGGTTTATLPSLPPLDPSTLELRKCRCGSGEAVVDGVCVSQDPFEGAGTPVPFLNPVTYEPIYFDSTQFGQVVTSELVCQDPSQRVAVNLGEFMLLPEQQLYWFGQVFYEYCIEHAPESQVQAWICLTSPPIPRCCPPQHVLQRDNSCAPKPDLKFQPPVSLRHGGTPTTFPDQRSSETIMNVTCEGIAKEHRAVLGSDSGDFLLYNKDRAVLTWFPPGSGKEEVKHAIEYCVGVEEEAGDLQYVAKVCHIDPVEMHNHTCANATCVRKCCPVGDFFFNQACVKAESAEENWKPNFHDPEQLTPGQDTPEDLAFISGFPLCSNFFQLKPEEENMDKYYLLADGSLHLPSQGTYPPSQYCMDMELSQSDDSVFTMKELTLVCVSETEANACEWKHMLIIVLVSISCVFLAATLAVYLSVAELRERTNGRCLISMVAAMLATYVTLVINREVRNTSDAQCYTRGFIGHFCSLATFFWLNVMCFDMWSTLRSSQQKYQSVKMFVIYSVYAWGCPLIIATVGFVMDTVKPENYIRPDFLGNTCWFHGDAEFWAYLAGIILVLVVANLGFFVHVAITLAQKLKKRRSMFNNDNSRTTNSDKRNNEQIWLFVRLFIVMGVVWVAEILSSFHRTDCSYWVLSDIINSLQGVLIFGVAVCNRDNIKKVRETIRYWTHADYHPVMKSVK